MEGYEGDVDSGDEFIDKRSIMTILDTELVLPGDDLFFKLSGEEYGIGLKVKDSRDIGIPEMRAELRVSAWLANQDNVTPVNYDEFETLEDMIEDLSPSGGGRNPERKRKRKSKSVRTRATKTCTTCGDIFFNSETNLFQDMKNLRLNCKEQEAIKECTICSNKTRNLSIDVVKPCDSNSSPNVNNNNPSQGQGPNMTEDSQGRYESSKRKPEIVKRNVCPICFESVSVGQLKRHYRTWHGIIEEKASDNEKRLGPRRGRNNEAESKNHGKKKCPICHLLFRNLDSHTRTHSLEHVNKKMDFKNNKQRKVGKVKCTLCKKMISASTLTFHNKRYHGTAEEINCFLEERRNKARRRARAKKCKILEL